MSLSLCLSLSLCFISYVPCGHLTENSLFYHSRRLLGGCPLTFATENSLASYLGRVVAGWCVECLLPPLSCLLESIQTCLWRHPRSWRCSPSARAWLVMNTDSSLWPGLPWTKVTQSKAVWEDPGENSYIKHPHGRYASAAVFTPCCTLHRVRVRGWWSLHVSRFFVDTGSRCGIHYLYYSVISEGGVLCVEIQCECHIMMSQNASCSRMPTQQVDCRQMGLEPNTLWVCCLFSGWRTPQGSGIVLWWALCGNAVAQSPLLRTVFASWCW